MPEICTHCGSELPMTKHLSETCHYRAIQFNAIGKSPMKPKSFQLSDVEQHIALKNNSKLTSGKKVVSTYRLIPLPPKTIDKKQSYIQSIFSTPNKTTGRSIPRSIISSISNDDSCSSSGSSIFKESATFESNGHYGVFIKEKSKSRFRRRKCKVCKSNTHFYCNKCGKALCNPKTRDKLTKSAKDCPSKTICSVLED